MEHNSNFIIYLLYFINFVTLYNQLNITIRFEYSDE